MASIEVFKGFARLLGRLRPEAWDWIVPHGPALAVLGPQPEPWRAIAQSVLGPRPEPWRAVAQAVLGDPVPWRAAALNQPPRELMAIAVADAHLTQVVHLANLSRLVPGDFAESLRNAALRIVADVDDICPPRWPWPPKGGGWPPPPPPPWLRDDDVVSPSEAFFMGARFLLAADAVEDDRIRQALTDIGSKLMGTGLTDAG